MSLTFETHQTCQATPLALLEKLKTYCFNNFVSFFAQFQFAFQTSQHTMTEIDLLGFFFNITDWFHLTDCQLENTDFPAGGQTQIPGITSWPLCGNYQNISAIFCTGQFF